MASILASYIYVQANNSSREAVVVYFINVYLDFSYVWGIIPQIIKIFTAELTFLILRTEVKNLQDDYITLYVIIWHIRT